MYSKDSNMLKIKDITRWLILVAVYCLAVGNPGRLRGQVNGAEMQTAKARAKQPPNILFIYLDDLGYGDVSCLNPQSKISTPNIDRLAKEGMSFTDAHTPAPICGPSRYGLLTGQYPWRSGAGGVDNGQTFDELRIKPDRSTIAKMLRNHGYNTAQMGKWGLRENYSAARREGVETMVDKTSFDFIHNRLLGANLCGFDYTWSLPHLSAEKNDKYVFENGRPTGVNYSPDLEKHGKANSPFQPIRKYEDVLPDNTGAVIDYLNVYSGFKDRPELKLDRQKPFFVYWDPPSPHEPIVPNREFIGKTEAGKYGDFVFEIDHCIGRVLEVLKKNGLEENTIIVVSSDNGPENLAYERIKTYKHYSMGALRGLKRDSWEGGTRVPFIVKWSGKIAPDSVCKNPIGVIDTFSTIAEITGITLGEQDAPDSISFLPLLLGQNPKRGRPPMIYHTSANMAIREGDWVYFEKTGMGSVEPGWFREERCVKSFVKEGPELFNLKTDPQQLINLASELPERVNALKAELDRVKKAGRIR